MQSDILPFPPVAHDIHMGILGNKGMDEILQRELYSYSEDSSRFVFFPSLPPSPPISMDATAAASKCMMPATPSKGRVAQAHHDYSSAGSGHSQSNSASDEAEDQQNNRNQSHSHGAIDERKQRRMLSNRESARRSRMRKQRHLDELRAQVAHMRTENRQMMHSFEIVSRRYNQILDENRLLKSQTLDLSNQLHQLQQALASSQSPTSFAAAAFKTLASHSHFQNNNNINNIQVDDHTLLTLTSCSDCEH